MYVSEAPDRNQVGLPLRKVAIAVVDADRERA